MILAYLLLLLGGLVLTTRAARRRSRHALTAGGGTVLALLAILGGFSIGLYLAAAGALLLITAGTQVAGRDHVG